MGKFDRIFQLHSVLVSRRTPIAIEDLEARLECSRRTLFRTIATLRDQLNAPVVIENGACKYGASATGKTYELPGQTVMHFHMHVIPRYRGDASDPRGGVRWVLRDQAAYWQSGDQ
jgi:diadenosine tetraphosphate (Ap4A) HIT family hydrolase